MKRILVVAAHPDDEVLGCGGTIARMSREGHDITIAILGEGITARYPKPEKARRSLTAKLGENTRKAADLLGVKKVIAKTLPDNRFDTVPMLEIIKMIEEIIKKTSPQIIYTHHGGDLNIDHMIVNRAVLTATRPMTDFAVGEIYSFEVPSSTEWTFGQFRPAFKPNVFVEVSTSLEKKLAAMEIYESETRQFPHPRSREALIAIARRWGSVAGLQAAEAFELVRLTV